MKPESIQFESLRAELDSEHQVSRMKILARLNRAKRDLEREDSDYKTKIEALKWVAARAGASHHVEDHSVEPKSSSQMNADQMEAELLGILQHFKNRVFDSREVVNEFNRRRNQEKETDRERSYITKALIRLYGEGVLAQIEEGAGRRPAKYCHVIGGFGSGEAIENSEL